MLRFLSFLAIVLSTGWYVSDVQAQQKSIEWKFNSVIPEVTLGGQAEKYWIDEVNKRSGGRLNLKGYWSGELGYKGPEILNVIKNGLVPVSGFVDVQVSGALPELSVVSLGFLIADPAQSEIVREDVARLIGKKTRQNWNAVLVGFWPSLGQTIITKKPIRSVRDLKGMKIRTSTHEQAQVVLAVGAFPQNILFAEIYTSMQLGVVEGFITGARNVIDMKFNEVASSVVFPPVNTAWAGIIVNKAAFDALPPDLQQVLFDAGEAAALKALRDIVVTNRQLIDQLRAVGVGVTDLPSSELEQLRKQMIPIWDAWSARASPDGRALLQGIRAKLHPAT